MIAKTLGVAIAMFLAAAPAMAQVEAKDHSVDAAKRTADEAAKNAEANRPADDGKNAERKAEDLSKAVKGSDAKVSAVSSAVARDSKALSKDQSDALDYLKAAERFAPEIADSSNVAMDEQIARQNPAQAAEIAKAYQLLKVQVAKVKNPGLAARVKRLFLAFKSLVLGRGKGESGWTAQQLADFVTVYDSDRALENFTEIMTGAAVARSRGLSETVAVRQAALEFVARKKGWDLKTDEGRRQASDFVDKLFKERCVPA